MLAELEFYYAHNYSLCPKDTGFLANYKNLSTIAHSLSMSLLPFYVFGGYCILKKTPKTMKQVKWPLFTVFFWCTCVDFLTTSLLTPYFYFPALAGFCLGILGQIGIPISYLIYLGAVCIWAMIFSISGLFEDRFNSIPANDWKIRRKCTKVVYHSSRGLLCLLYPLPTLIFSPDQEQAKLQILKVLPCPTPEFFTSPVFTLQTDGVGTYVSIGVTVVLAVCEAAQIIFFGSYCLYFLCLYPSRFVSVRTRRLQAYYFYAIVVQIGVSALALVIPFAYFISSIVFKYYNQTITNICVLFFAIHGFLATLVVILIHSPYRSFARECISRIWCKGPQKKKSSTRAQLF